MNQNNKLGKICKKKPLKHEQRENLYNSKMETMNELHFKVSLGYTNIQPLHHREHNVIHWKDRFVNAVYKNNRCLF
jgi:hypothetical protein